MIELLTPQSAAEVHAVRELLREYAAAIGIDLCFQDFDHELSVLPGEYRQPRGALLAAYVDDALAGCCALRPLDNVHYTNASEMKRLYVRPSFRGQGLGRMLAEAILDAARIAGYSCVLLDTLSGMETARALYQGLGFVEIPPYYFSPTDGSHCLKVDL